LCLHRVTFAFVFWWGRFVVSYRGKYTERHTVSIFYLLVYCLTTMTSQWEKFYMLSKINKLWFIYSFCVFTEWRLLLSFDEVSLPFRYMNIVWLLAAIQFKKSIIVVLERLKSFHWRRLDSVFTEIVWKLSLIHSVKTQKLN
jgi:hypothetical protein